MHYGERDKGDGGGEVLGGSRGLDDELQARRKQT